MKPGGRLRHSSESAHERTRITRPRLGRFASLRTGWRLEDPFAQRRIFLPRKGLLGIHNRPRGITILRFETPSSVALRLDDYWALKLDSFVILLLGPIAECSVERLSSQGWSVAGISLGGWAHPWFVSPCLADGQAAGSVCFAPGCVESGVLWCVTAQ